MLNGISLSYLKKTVHLKDNTGQTSSAVHGL